MKQSNIRRRPDAGITIFLSLFLLLLAFFILLNALATIEETKSRQVITSVAAAFRSVVDAEARAQILISDLGPTPEAEEVLEALDQLWVTSVPVAKVEKLTQGQIMQMTIPVNELFLGGQAVLRADRESLFDRTGLLLGLATKGAVTEAQIAFGTRRGEGTLADREGQLAAERAGRIAAALVAHDAPSERLSIGLWDSDPSLLRVRFEIRDAARAQVTFKKEDGQ